MGRADPHDRRTFQHYAKLNARGAVVAIVEVADGSTPPPGGEAIYLDVTDAYPYDFTDVTIEVTRDNQAQPAVDYEASRATLVAANRVSRG